MHFDFHLTRMTERLKIMQKRNFDLIEVNPEDVVHQGGEYFERGKPIIWDEDYNDFYEVYYSVIPETLKQYDKNPKIKIEDTAYYKKYIDRKGKDYFETRLPQLFEIYESIRKEGIKEPIILEKTGERVDGSYRSSIATHLGLKKIPAKLYELNWWETTRDFILRKIQGHYLGLGADYYYIEYNNELRNFPHKDTGIYEENAGTRWREILSPTLFPMAGKRFLDLGCNQGYVSCMIGKQGGVVRGVDRISQATSNLNKLIFQVVAREDLFIEFEEADLSDYKVKEDYDWVLLLNTIYHLPKEKQLPLLKRIREKTKNIILQCNLRKINEREKYYGSHPDDAIKLLEQSGFKNIKKIDWRQKPVIIAQ